jgi:hypothetical protein
MYLFSSFYSIIIFSLTNSLSLLDHGTPFFDFFKLNNPPHLLELLHSSINYHQFEVNVIQPFYLETKTQAALSNNLCISLNFTLDSPSFDEHHQFFSEMNYNHFSPSKLLISILMIFLQNHYAPFETTSVPNVQTILFKNLVLLSRNLL